MTEWIQTDDYQWQRKVDDHYDMMQIEYIGYLDDYRYFAGGGSFLLSDYGQEEIDFDIKQFGYTDIDDVKRIYGDHWERIVAECVFECNWADFPLETFRTMEDAEAWTSDQLQNW